MSVARIEKEIERLIVGGVYPPGAHLNESALAAEIGVGRASIREACRLLERAGLVRIVPNQGAYVSALTLPQIVDLFDIRASLARLAGQRAAATIDATHLDALRSTMDEMDEVARKRDADRYVELNLQFHAALYQATGNQRLAMLDESIGKELRIYRRHGLAFGGGLLISNQEHREIFGAIERGNCEVAGAALEKHILGGRDRFLRAMSATGQLALRNSGTTGGPRSRS
jgi:DNA-binding GntR family transcriptional regulator